MSPGPWNAPRFVVRNFTGNPSKDCALVSWTLGMRVRTALRVVVPRPAAHAFLIAVALTQVAVYDGRPNSSWFPPCLLANALTFLLAKSTGKPETRLPAPVKDAGSSVPSEPNTIVVVEGR